MSILFKLLFFTNNLIVPNSRSMGKSSFQLDDQIIYSEGKANIFNKCEADVYTSLEYS